VLEEHHPVEPLLFSPRTVNYTQNANPMTDWCVQYCVYASYCCCSNLYTRITEHDNNQPHWMKDISWLHQKWYVQ